MFLHLPSVALVVLLYTAVVHSAQNALPSATIEGGIVVGTTTKVDSIPSSTVVVNKFLGIPFAAPPERFSPPMPPAPWKNPLKATKNKPACIQSFAAPKAYQNILQQLGNTPPPEAGESEDCLFINVWAPSSPAPKSGRTVIFWIYGGALQFGSNSFPYYDGASFATHQDVIVVAPNYRTNVFGFPMSPELPLTERNLGFLDQRLALNWTRNNIHAFGGDPDKITIFGESAGSASVDELITTTPTNPPFRAGIMASGQTSLYLNHNNSDTLMWDILTEILNCTSKADVLACVRSAKASTIKAILQDTPLFFSPSSDNVTQLEFPEAARVAGNVAKVPVLLGTTANEGTFFAVGEDNTTAFLSQTFPGLPQLWSAIEQAYPLGSSPNLKNQYLVNSAIDTDFEFQCPCAIVANDSYNIGVPTWRYLFNATFPLTQVKAFPELGVYHGSELVLVFGTFPPEAVSATLRRVSREMQTAWADFAKDPMKGPGWKEYPGVNVIGPGTSETIESPEVLDARCELYQEVYEYLGVIG